MVLRVAGGLALANLVETQRRHAVSGLIGQSETQALGDVARNGVVPTVLRFDGLRAVMYPNDHRPAHVHTIGRGHEAVFNLNCPVELLENYGFSRREVRPPYRRRACRLTGAGCIRQTTPNLRRISSLTANAGPS